MGFSLKKLVKKVTAPVRAVGRAIDPTSSSGLGGLGKYTRVIAKPAVATAAVGLTGGLALASSRIREDAAKGYAVGAAAGGALLSGGGIAAAAAAGVRPVVSGESVAPSAGSPTAAPPWGGLPLPDAQPPALLASHGPASGEPEGGGLFDSVPASWRSPLVIGGGLLLLLILLLASRD